jgi:hypothetical protein
MCPFRGFSFVVVGLTMRAFLRDSRTWRVPWITCPFLGDRMLILAGELGRVATGVVEDAGGLGELLPPQAVAVTAVSSISPNARLIIRMSFLYLMSWLK